MTHITMLHHDEELGHVQCVIGSNMKDKFESLGFVDHIDKVKSPKAKETTAQKKKRIASEDAAAAELLAGEAEKQRLIDEANEQGNN